MFDNYKIN